MARSNVTIPMPKNYLIIPSFVSPKNASSAEQPHDKVARDLKLIFTKTLLKITIMLPELCKEVG
jgi:hypothetical protein